MAQVQEKVQFKEVEKKGLYRHFSVLLDRKFLDDRFTEKLMEKQLNFQLKGFRRGKVPITIVQNMVGGEVRNSTLQEILTESVDEHFRKEGVAPLQSPNLDISPDNSENSEYLMFDLKYEVSPNILEVDYSSLGLEKPVVEITDDMINKALEDIAKNSVTYEEKAEGAVVEDKDRVTLDASGHVGEEKIENGTIKNHPVVIGSGALVADFESKLKGFKVGDTPEVNVVFPEDYHMEALRGKEAKFSCQINKIESPVDVPEIGEELAKMSNFDSLEDMKKDVEQRIKAFLDDKSNFVFKNYLAKAIESKLDFDVPESVLKKELEILGYTGSISDETSEEEGDSKNPEGDVSVANTGDISDDAKVKEAKDRVRLSMYLSMVARKKMIDLKEEEFSRIVDQNARDLYPGHEQEYVKWLNSDMSRVREVYFTALQEKVLDFISNTVHSGEKKVTAEELDEAARSVI